MNKILKKNGINFGLILGFLSTLPTLLGYGLDISYLVNTGTFVYIFLIIIIIGIINIVVVRKKLSGYISFKNAFLTYFIMLLTSVLLSSTVNYLVVNVIDQNFDQKIKNKQIELIENQREQFIENSGSASEDEIKEIQDTFTKSIEKIKTTNNYSFVSILKGIGVYLTIFSIFGLLLATILKRQPKNA